MYICYNFLSITTYKYKKYKYYYDIFHNGIYKKYLKIILRKNEEILIIFFIFRINVKNNLCQYSSF